MNARISIRPLDVGFDPKAHNIPVNLPQSTTEVSYLDQDGTPATANGNRAEIQATLTRAGYIVARPIYALTREDVAYLGNAPAAAGGWVTVWDDEDNGLDLPDIILRIAGRQYLGTMSGIDPEREVSIDVLREILSESGAQPLTSEHPLVRAAATRRDVWHAVIRGWI